MKTGPLTIRLTVLLLILVGVHAAYAFFRSGTPHKVRPPKRDLNELPVQLGDWQHRSMDRGEAVLDDPSGADDSIRRVYSRAGEPAMISAYVAVWTAYEGSFLPHEPTECYPATGHVIQQTSEVQLTRPDGATVSARLIRAEHNGQPTYVLYWYQLERTTLYTISGLRESRWTYLGTDSWPPLVKVMLDVRGTTSDEATQLLVDLGEQILGWTSTSL